MKKKKKLTAVGQTVLQWFPVPANDCNTKGQRIQVKIFFTIKTYVQIN